jgi:transposase
MSKQCPVSMDVVGMDVSKATFDASLACGTGAGQGLRPMDLPAQSFPRTPEGVAAFAAWCEQHCTRTDGPSKTLVVMEATGRYSQELAVWLAAQDRRFETAIVNPHEAAHHRKSFGLRNNTDKLAARALALFGLERRPAAFEALTPARAALRALCRYREDLVGMATAAKIRLQEPPADPWVRKQEQAQLRQLERAIDKVEKKMKAHVEQHGELRRDVALLETIRGVGFLTAVVVLAELGDLRRFAKARQLSAFAGLSPEHCESGTSVHRRPRMSKKGNARVRRAVYLAAITTIRYESGLQAAYTKLLSQGKPRMAALGAVMRKMLCLMRAMLITNTPFNCHRLTGG